MVTIRDILNEKGQNIYAVNPQTTVYESLEKMSEHDVGSMLVMEGDKLLGIFTERDYMKKIILQNKASKTTMIKEIMTTNPVCITPSDSVDNAMSIMTKQRCRHLPIIEESKIIGVVSIGDLVKKKISAMDATIKYLSDYISSEGYQ
jgi:CBS domain-containing protein